MKKIGILTHYYRSKNIGGLLQAYALTDFLNRHGYAAEQITFDYNFLDASARRTYWQLRCERFTVKKLGLRIAGFFRRPWRKREQQKIRPQLSLQHNLAAEFEQFIPHSQTVYNNLTLPQANAHYDGFISGSDQVWALYLLPLSAFWGEFASPDKKVISYAASSNVRQFSPKAEKLFVQKLARLQAISVREKTLKNYIERLTHRQASVVLDPTFLLSAQEWLALASSAPVPQKPYIFCYFLGEKSAWQRQLAQAYADKYGCQVVHLPYIQGSLRPADKYLKSPGCYQAGPREFIALINGAQCVFTDSFHGTAFSINFGKNFYAFNRDGVVGTDSMNARIVDLLELLGLSARHITHPNAALSCEPLDYSRARPVLAREKQQSMDWLLKALKG